MTEKFICFDIGGTKIFQGVVEVDFGRRKFEFLDSKTIKNPINAEEIKQITIDYCQKNKEKFKTNKIAVSCPSLVDSRNLKVSNAKKAYGTEEFSFIFLKKAGFQVVIKNDGKSFVLGEYYFNNNESKQGLLTLTLGTRIGGGFIDSNGQLFEGRSESAVELSYIKMFIDNQWKKWCEISSGKGIEKMYLEKTGKIKETKIIFELSRTGDKIATEIIVKSQEYLEQGIISLIEIFNPEKIVFGGGISSQRDYIEKVMKFARKDIFHKKIFPEWSISELKEETNVLGVCALYYI